MSIDGLAGISGVSNRATEILLDLSSKVNELTSDVRDSANLTSKINEESNKSFFHVMKGMEETLLFRTENGNIGGLVNFKDSPEDIAEVLSKNQFVKIQENPDMPAHLKNGISLIA